MSLVLTTLGQNFQGTLYPGHFILETLKPTIFVSGQFVWERPITPLLERMAANGMRVS